MRALASYVAGILILVMLLAAGGAWTTLPGSSMVSVELNPETIELPYQGDLPEISAQEVTPLSVGCDPPLDGSVCPIPEPRELEPIGPHDLIPADPKGVDAWRPLIEYFFEADDVDRAMRVLECESRGDPLAKNPTSTASGLFQHLASLWEERSVLAGWEGSDVFDPVANVAVAAWLVYEYGGWSHWNPTRGCW